MTSRGNPSISPPAQQRHVNTISSSTPPPQQQFFPGTSSLPQGGYDYIQPQPQGQTFLPYQAYGSAVNDARAQPGSSGRGGPPQQNLSQGGGYYQQSGQNMRPQQSQQGPTAQQYFLSTPSVRQRTPHPSSSQVVVYPTAGYPGGNNVIQIPANMYHQTTRVPLYQPQYAAGSVPYPGSNVMYFHNNAQWRPGMAPTTVQQVRPQVREKKVLSICDPDTGRNIIEEILNNRPQSADVDDHHEDNQSGSQNEIAKTFTRLVADRLKTPDESSVSGGQADSQGALSGTTAGSAAAAQSSQFQTPPPQQVQQQQQQQAPLTPSSMMRPHMSGPPPIPPHTHMMPPRPNMMQHPPPSATPPHDMQHQVINFSMPPPQIPMRQPGTVMFNPNQQQLPVHHGPRQQPAPPPQQQQQQGVRPQMTPVIPASTPQAPSIVSAPHQSPAADNVPQPVRSEASTLEKRKPSVDNIRKENIPVKTPVTAAPPPVTVNKPQSPPTSLETQVKEEAPAKQETHNIKQTEADAKPSTVLASPKETPKTEKVLPTSEKVDERTKDESGTGSQSGKDGRKGKKNKKDFNRKEIGGTDMDAFTDPSENDVIETDGKPPLPPVIGDRRNSQQEKSVPELKTAMTTAPTSQDASKAIKEASPQLETSTLPSTPPASDMSIKSLPQIFKEKQDDSVPSFTPHHNQNQSVGETKESISSNSGLQRQAEIPAKQPIDNGISSDLNPEIVTPVPSDINNVMSHNMNQKPFNDENEPPKDLSKPKEDSKKILQTGADNDEAPTKPSSEKATSKVKKDGKEKLQYDRAYLMELRECASSQTKPDGLPNLEIILDRPMANSNRGASSTPLDFTPGFFQTSVNQGRHAPPIGKTNSRNRNRPDLQMPQRVIKSVSLTSDVKPLHQSEKPWKPTPKQLSAGELAEKRKNLEAEVLFIMNRLTPTNFDKLADEMQKLNIKTYEDLQELVKIFFDKVTMETKFVEAYARLCKVMSGLRVQPPPNSGIKDNQATFRVVMLTKCQQEFEADKSIVFEDPEEKKRKIEAEMPDGPERAEKIEKTLYQMKLKRLKFYGNIRFIGELFKLGMLTENIMHDCIFRLLKARDDDSLVSLCQLVTTVGEALDTEKARSRMDQYFAQMGKIAEERKSRIKFTLKDAIDLRNHNWVPRKEQTVPKKIDEVHKDYQQEQATKQFLQSQPLPPRQDTPQPGSRRGSRQRQDDNKPTDDGWNTVSSKSFRIDASKMKLSKQSVVDENSIQLGPGAGMNKFSMWGRGSFGGAQPTQDSDRPAPAANRFSALRSEEDRRNFQRSPSRGDSGVASRGMRQGPTAGHGRGKILARSSQEGERRDALASARSIVGGRSQNSSRDNSWNREDRRQTMGPRGSREGENVMTRSDISLRPNTDSLLPPTVPSTSRGAGVDDDRAVKKLKPMSQEEMEQKAKNILEEYLNVRDLKEAKLCVMELEGQTYLHALVTACINDVLERSSKERDLTGQFFDEMLKNNLISMDMYIKGLSEVLQYGEDMVIDIPMLWAYLAQMIVPLLLGGSLPWSKLASALKASLDGRTCAKLLAEILLLSKDKMSEGEVAQQWQSSGMSWDLFLDPADVDRFLEDKRLEFTIGPVSGGSPSKTPGQGHIDMQRITEDIEKLVKDNAQNSEIFSYVEKTVPVDRRDKAFIRALMTAIASSSILPSRKANEEVIKVRKDVLSFYIASNPELELQALYAIQALMHKLEHPSGVVVSFFEILCEEEVINEDTFKQWEKSSDPQEQEGKGPCSKQLTQFFTWLRENEEPEAS